jgi:hypothetical protein
MEHKAAAFFVITVFLFAGCNSDKKISTVTVPVTGYETAETDAVKTEAEAAEEEEYGEEYEEEFQETLYDIVSGTFTQDEITIRYPQIQRLGDDAREKAINDLIVNDLIASQVPGPDFNHGYPFILELNLEYEVTLRTPELLSLLFTGDSVFYAGVPDVRSSFRNAENVYGITIDLTRVEKLRLEDFTVIDEELVRKIRESPNVTNGLVKAGVMDKEKLRMISEDELKDSEFTIKALSDGGGSVYTFCVTPNSLIVSIGIVTARGHYALIEIPYRHTKYRSVN